jgi:hypothetical protein
MVVIVVMVSLMVAEVNEEEELHMPYVLHEIVLRKDSRTYISLPKSMSRNDIVT